jgi:GNAT superfamily N-acetyltransferase
MENIGIRRMQLSDVHAIVEINASDIDGWVDRCEEGSSLSQVYWGLSLAERFNQGGAGMSLETCAVYINNMLTTEGVFPLVAEVDCGVVAHGELFIGKDASTLGKNAHLSELYVHRDYRSRGIGSAMLYRYLKIAAEHRCTTFSTLPDDDAVPFYKRHGFLDTFPQKRLAITVPERCETVRYTVLEGLAYAADAIPMRIGRLQSSVQMWHQAMWTPYAINGMGRRFGIFELSMRGSAYLAIVQVFNQPQTANIFVWADAHIPLLDLVRASLGVAGELGFKKMMVVIPEMEADHALIKHFGAELVGNHDLLIRKMGD